MPLGKWRDFPIARFSTHPTLRSMWDWLGNVETREFIGSGLGWMVTGSLLLAGLAGCIIPVIPGHLIIMIGAIAHRLMFGDESGVAWWTFPILVALMIASQTIELLSGAAGSRWFGGSKWGASGALLGGILGIFFMPFGLLAGPLIGAVLLEMLFAGKSPKPAVISGMGSVVGTLAGVLVKLAFGALMVGWFLTDVFFVNQQ